MTRGTVFDDKWGGRGSDRKEKPACTVTGTGYHREAGVQSSLVCSSGMDGLEGNADSRVVKPMEPSTKIALVPFVQGEPSVHLLDQDGKASTAR